LGELKANSVTATEMIAFRKQIARQIIDSDTEVDIGHMPYLFVPEMSEAIAVRKRATLPSVTWPNKEVEPILQDVEPQPDDPLPEADWLVITWTKAEHAALRAVFAPRLPVDRWLKYRHNFQSYEPELRKGAPALSANRIASYCMVEIKGFKVLCLKSEFHLNQDGPKLPLLRLTEQLLNETQAKDVLSIGTAGGVRGEDELGDVIISQSALFRLKDEFKNEPFNGKTFGNSWEASTKMFDYASKQMISLQEPSYAPPTKRVPFTGPPVSLPPNKPNISYVPDRPIITTDYFEFGTSGNNLDEIGSAVEMDDALIAMVCQQSQNKPNFAFVRNISDPVINADLDEKVQIMWAVWYYEQFGLQTSYNGALAAWAMIAGS
jgi:nucleoside phosphorylase